MTSSLRFVALGLQALLLLLVFSPVSAQSVIPGLPATAEAPAELQQQPLDATPTVPAPSKPAQGTTAPSGPQPFGHNLFLGNFLRSRQDGLNPDYVVMPGDRVSVQTWGSITMQGVFVVDAQGNLFLPEIGPVPVAGVPNANLTEVVEKYIRRVYVRHFGVYTNLLTARPVAVFVTGGVRRPGSYAGIPSDSVLFFLDQAGGIDPALGSYRDIHVLRGGEPVAQVDLYDFILNGSLAPIQFKNGDTILVTRRGPLVELDGNVASPALVELQGDAARGSEVLSVVPKEARANEVTLRGIRGSMPYQRTMSVAEFSTTLVRDGDRVTLRDDGHAESILVHIEGEFEGPSTLSVPRGTRLIDLLNHVAVNPELSNFAAAHIRRNSVARAQKDAIEDSLFRLERSSLLALSASTGEAEIRVKEAQLMQRFVERARLIDPLGRVVTARNGQQQNMLLEEGDTVVLPQRTAVIRVSGEVQMTHAGVHEEGLTAAAYIEAAGGYTDRADTGKIILIHANAEVEMASTDVVVYPGDEILVPPRVDSKTLQNAVDITQIIYQVAVAAGVVLRVAL